MEPITAGLLLALTAAIKEKAVGAAADKLLLSAKAQIQKLRALWPDKKDSEFAEAVVAHLIAEAAAYPPRKAIVVVPLANNRDRSGGSVGIWPPDSDLVVELMVINHADFPIWIRDLVFTGRVGGPAQTHEYEAKQGDEFILAAREHTTHIITARLRPNIAAPTFDRDGGASIDMTLRALVSGPWQDEPQATHELFRGGMWVPVFVDPSRLLADDADIDIALDQWFSMTFNPNIIAGIKPSVHRYDDVDNQCGVVKGSSKRRLAAIARRHHYEVVEGKDTIQIKWTERAAASAQKPPPLFRR